MGPAPLETAAGPEGAISGERDVDMDALWVTGGSPGKEGFYKREKHKVFSRPSQKWIETRCAFHV